MRCRQRQRLVLDALAVAGIAEKLGPAARQRVALIEGPQRQQSTVASDLPAGKIGADGLMAVEGEAQLW
ncbi:MAG: hypothetical protein WCC92_17805 [Candidatus Korobacteraceae bacterium]